MKIIELRKHITNKISGKEVNYLIFIILLAFFMGIIVSFGFFTLTQAVILSAAIFFLFFIFNKPDMICLVAVILMFIPLSLGTVYKLRITWAAEPVLMILFFLIILRNLNARKKSSVLALRENPFLIALFLYVVVFILNYIRYPLPASSVVGVAEEMGGIRFYYEKILMFSFCLSIGYLVEMNNDFTRRFFRLLLWMITIVTVVGILIFLVHPVYNLIEVLRSGGIFTESTMLTGLWYKGVDPFTHALRNSILWITPLGILILVANMIDLKKLIKILLLIFFLVGLILSATRNFFFGTLLAFIAWAFLTKNKKVLILLIVVTIIGFLLPHIGLLSRQFDRILYFPSDLERLSSFRFKLFETYWTVFQQHPLFGVGVGATEIGRLSPASPEYFILQNLRFGGHGFFLGTLYTQGIVGLIPFLLLYSVSIKIGLKLFMSHDSYFSAVGLFALMFIAYSFIPFLVGGLETYNQFFVVIGILSGSYVQFRKCYATEI